MAGIASETQVRLLPADVMVKRRKPSGWDYSAAINIFALSQIPVVLSTFCCHNCAINFL